MTMRAASGVVLAVIVSLILVLVVTLVVVTNRGAAGKEITLSVSETYCDEGLCITVQDVGFQYTSTLGLVIENRDPGRIHYLPAWDGLTPGEGVTVIDEFGNRYHPLPRQYYRNALQPGTPTSPRSNRVDPGTRDVLVIEMETILKNSKTLTVLVPYKGQVLRFTDVRHNR